MESYASSIRHVDFECYSNSEDGTPAKQQKTMADEIVFRNRDADKVEAPTIDPLVISAQVGPAWMKRILVDSGSSVNILFKREYDLMKMEAKDLKPCQSRVQASTGVRQYQPEWLNCQWSWEWENAEEFGCCNLLSWIFLPRTMLFWADRPLLNLGLLLPHGV